MSRSRRKFLGCVTGAVAGIGAILAASPLFKSLNTPKHRNQNKPYIDIKINKIKPGETKIVDFRGKPFFVSRRKIEQISELEKDNADLRDPSSEWSVQPEYAKNKYRSLKPEVFVAAGMCTHLGCMPQHLTNEKMFFPKISSGYFCPCHGAKYDLAGRVFKAGPAPYNLEIPQYEYIEEGVVRIFDSMSN